MNSVDDMESTISSDLLDDITKIKSSKLHWEGNRYKSKSIAAIAELNYA
jgi:hypothetical protein